MYLVIGVGLIKTTILMIKRFKMPTSGTVKNTFIDIEIKC
jgi:hypothetical protein